MEEAKRPLAKAAKPVGKRALELEEAEDEGAGKKKRPLPGKKVVEYTARKKRDYTAELDGDRGAHEKKVRYAKRETGSETGCP